MNEALFEILENRFNMDKKEIRRFLMETEAVGVISLDELEKKLCLLESLGLLADISLEEETVTYAFPLFRCTYSELEFALDVPQMLEFSEEQKDKYLKRILYWSRYTDIREKVLPCLEKVCGKDEAVEIVKNLYISAYSTVSEDSLCEICSRLAQYPDDSGALAKFMSENWYLTFSVYSDPIYALEMLEGMFKREYVIEVFTDTCEWVRIGYLHNEPQLIQHMEEPWKNEVINRAKGKFAKYLK